MEFVEYKQYLDQLRDQNPDQRESYDNCVNLLGFHEMSLNELYMERLKYQGRVDRCTKKGKNTIGDRLALKATTRRFEVISMRVVYDIRSGLLQEIKDFSGVPPNCEGAVSGFHYKEAQRRFNKITNL